MGELLADCLCRSIPKRRSSNWDEGPNTFIARRIQLDIPAVCGDKWEGTHDDQAKDDNPVARRTRIESPCRTTAKSYGSVPTMECPRLLKQIRILGSDNTDKVSTCKTAAKVLRRSTFSSEKLRRESEPSSRERAESHLPFGKSSEECAMQTDTGAQRVEVSLVRHVLRFLIAFIHHRNRR